MSACMCASIGPHISPSYCLYLLFTTVFTYSLLLSLLTLYYCLTYSLLLSYLLFTTASIGPHISPSCVFICFPVCLAFPAWIQNIHIFSYVYVKRKNTFFPVCLAFPACPVCACVFIFLYFIFDHVSLYIFCLQIFLYVLRSLRVLCARVCVCVYVCACSGMRDEQDPARCRRSSAAARDRWRSTVSEIQNSQV